MKVNPAPLHLAQTVITALVVVFSIAILGTSAHTLDTYNKQRSTNPWWTPLWPQHFDTHGTKALIASAVVTLVLSGAFLIMSVVPKVRQILSNSQIPHPNHTQLALRESTLSAPSSPSEPPSPPSSSPS
jgi:hypothetical protein